VCKLRNTCLNKAIKVNASLIIQFADWPAFRELEFKLKNHTAWWTYKKNTIKSQRMGN
jgi:hypothetical protein